MFPKFLEEHRIEIMGIIDRVVSMAFTTFTMERDDLHVVVLAPTIEDDRKENYPAWPNYSMIPAAFCEYSHGDSSKWEYHFDTIAQCKVLQLWNDRNDERTDIQPHLLFPGDTPYWGGVKRHGLAVSCSGVQPWFDQMIAGMIADAIKAFCYDTWMNSKAKQEGLEFLP
ncbi:MAG: hypothetical protein COV10_04420 [Candidatus Vogelbacteria bacterium CG10_big_fil_rev_8_21_14_0_10_51_16]|uniref:Uncharacterized protein n=1 Tax=Candidatus Vogelbacteria bacterium CG10_big_fil_rev_8_21_14_0_10_51_16 TaxID=1975045 RepID=A0A2H0RDF2_9BACT|nr:MAG: hypothetical protein COV10_04420 [Candidatus Vogelbacteria bacterium CG10_big_fil_rev_8_21_14_0_10_51_16]